MKWKLITASALYLTTVLAIAGSPSEAKAVGLENNSAVYGNSTILETYPIEESSIEDMANFLETISGTQDTYSWSKEISITKEKVESTAVSQDGQIIKIAKNRTFELKEDKSGSYKNTLNHLGIVKCDSKVNIRSSATTEDEENIVGKAYNNNAVVIEDVVESEDGLWYKVTSGNAEGYIHSDYLVIGKEARSLAEEIFQKQGTVDTAALRLREEPSLDAAVVVNMQEGETCIIEEEAENGFVKVLTEDQEEGYVAEEYLNVQYIFEWALTKEEYAQKIREEEAARNLKKAQAEMESIQADMESVYTDYTGNMDAGNYTKAVKSAEQYIAYAKSIVAVGENYEAEEVITYGQKEVNKGETYLQNAKDKVQEVEAARKAAEEKAAADRAAAAAAAAAASTTAPSAGNSGSSASTAPTAPSAPTTPSAPAVTNVTAVRQALAAEALKWPGKCNYVLGGTNLGVGGAVDCSGFTLCLYRNVAGITLKRTAAAQSTMGRRIALSDVKPGDLVFYYNGDKIGHVAIYVGNGKIVHAKNPSAGIGIDNMYYKQPACAVSILD